MLQTVMNASFVLADPYYSNHESDPTNIMVEIKTGVTNTEHSAKINMERSYFRLFIQLRRGKQCLTDTLL